MKRLKSKIKAWLVKALMPDAEDMARLATRTVADFINTSGKEAVIAKYGSMADNFTKVQAYITGWLRDGRIDDAEQEQLYKAILPLAEKLVKEATERIKEGD